jgi:hypothetical protein
MGVFRSFGNKKFWRLIPMHRVVCGQHFGTDHFGVQHFVGELYIFGPYRGWSVVLLANAEDLNSCYELCVKITKVEICVASFVHLHLCLLGYISCLLACWLSCHMLLQGKGILKVCHLVMIWG